MGGEHPVVLSFGVLVRGAIETGHFLVQGPRKGNGKDSSSLTGDLGAQSELCNLRLLVVGDVGDLDRGFGGLDIDATLLQLQLLVVDGDGASRLLQLEGNLDGSIVGEILEVEVGDVQLVVGGGDAELSVSILEGFWRTAYCEGRISLSVGLDPSLLIVS